MTATPHSFFPGLYELDFEHTMQYLTKHLLGWLTWKCAWLLDSTLHFNVFITAHMGTLDGQCGWMAKSGEPSLEI